MKRSKHLHLLLAVMMMLALGGCQGIEEIVKTNPLGALESVGRIGSAAAKASQDITEEQEHYLGRTVSARILKQYPLYSNAKLTRYVNLVGTTVAGVSDRPDLNYHFAVLNTSEVNAFAAPGGYIFITRGMIDKMNNEEELAAVLAHEVGHVAARHSLKSIKGDLWKQVAVITAQEAGRHQGVDPQLLDLFSQATDGVISTLVTVGYSQSMEFEADQLGETYAARAGYDPSATLEYLKEMEKRAEGRDRTLSARLGTHPSFQARVQELPPVNAPAPDPAMVKLRQARFMKATR